MGVPRNQEQDKTKKSLIKSEDSKTLSKWYMTKYEAMWRILFLFIFIAGSVLVRKIYLFQTSPELAHVPKGQISDFWLSVLVAGLIGVVRYLIKLKLQEKILNFLSEKRLQTPEDAKRRSDQLCKWLFDVFYYSCSSIAAYLILKDQNFLSPALGGPSEGSCLLLFQEYPFVPHVPYLKVFYLIQAGTHLYTFFHQLIFKFNDPKYYEFVLHHGLALFLIIFSYLMNFTLVGAVVLMLHDPCDVLLICSRAYTDYRYRKVSINIAIYVVTYTGWVYLRNVQLPWCVIRSSINFFFHETRENLLEITYFPIIYQITMLSILAFMQFYWTMFLTKAAISMLSKGKDKNGYDS